MKLILHNYFRSSTSTRLRAALNLKGLEYDYQSYALKDGAAKKPSYLRINPQGLVPALELEDGIILTQSLAIIEWLEEQYPTPPLLPTEPIARAKVRALAQTIAMEIHPLNNLRVLGYLQDNLSANSEAVSSWFQHWVSETFIPLEKMLNEGDNLGDFCFGNTPGMADCCLYAQVWNNRRFDIDLSIYPRISSIFEACDANPAFNKAAPKQQIDASPL